MPKSVRVDEWIQCVEEWMGRPWRFPPAFIESFQELAGRVSRLRKGRERKDDERAEIPPHGRNALLALGHHRKMDYRPARTKATEGTTGEDGNMELRGTC
jgi:hypothetical protein